MKKTLIIALSGLMLTGAMTSCKKGENDPFLSLKSRTSRVAGEWTVTASTSHTKMTQGTNSDENSYTYVDGTETRVQTLSNGGGSISQTTTYTYTETYEFTKEGTFTRTMTNANGKVVTTGKWAFLGKNKEGDLKSKEAIMLSIEKIEDTPTGEATETTTSTGYSNNIIMTIDQLKGKEMILKNESVSDDGSTKYESNGEWTLTLD